MTAERYVTHFVQDSHQLLVAAHFTSLKNPAGPFLPHTIFCEGHSEAGLRAETVEELAFSISYIVPNDPKKLQVLFLTFNYNYIYI